MEWDGFTYRCLYESANDGDCYTPKSGIAIYVGTPPYPYFKFPSVFLPVTMIIGFFGGCVAIGERENNIFLFMVSSFKIIRAFKFACIGLKRSTDHLPIKYV